MAAESLCVHDASVGERDKHGREQAMGGEGRIGEETAGGVDAEGVGGCVIEIEGKLLTSLRGLVEPGERTAAAKVSFEVVWVCGDKGGVDGFGFGGFFGLSLVVEGDE